MNLKKLFEIQGGLDAHIVKEKGLEGQDLLPRKILALQVELGELANEWRGFKFWSNDQEPKTEEWTSEIDSFGKSMPRLRNPLLEEYVDCLHFILSIGLELHVPDEWDLESIVPEKRDEVNDQFLAFNEFLHEDLDDSDWLDIADLFVGLGEMLGFTLEQIEEDYLKKNEVNHQRQLTGY
ncbi:dUTP diphosphatase [Halobacillus litoralis]|uniref:dUTPase n=1 Tax=Halobacillus litoralis TaxID=45668 RepID=A0A410MCE5_9BACI|nr:dUTP diphosphatase [Halobacillus litoralis]QAS52401.1 hypothetical protein HLI_09225 [Halobacillus litoralis]